MIGYLLFRNQTATLISKKGLLGIIIIGSLGLIRLKVYDYQSCTWSIDVTLNVISTLILLAVLIIGFGINNIRNHERIKSNAFEINRNENGE